MDRRYEQGSSKEATTPERECTSTANLFMLPSEHTMVKESLLRIEHRASSMYRSTSQ
jgi:hypothetical protein